MSEHQEPGIRVGAVLAERYELRRVVGEGGMGTVFEGFDRVLERRVAVKFLRASLTEHADLVARFELEAKIASAFQHANVATTFDVGRHESGARYLVMEFLEGVSLAHALSRAALLSDRAAVALVEPIARALAKAHQAGVVHRDVKPENIFLVHGERPGECVPKLVDFGIARREQDASHRLTASSTILGTPAYMPPEQARGSSDLTGAVDQYALAVVLYELVSGANPHPATSTPALLARKLTEPPIDLRAIAPHVSRELSAVVMRALEKSPADRFSDMNEFREALVRSVAALDPPTIPPSVREPALASAPQVDSDANTLAAAPEDAQRPKRSTPATRMSTPVYDDGAPFVSPALSAPPDEPRRSQPSRPRGARAGVVFALAAGLAIAVVSVARVRASSRPSPAIGSTPARIDVDASARPVLEVRVEPPAASIVVDGVERGHGNVRVVVEPGREVAIVISAAGFATVTERRRVANDDRIERVLVPIAPPTPVVVNNADASIRAPHAEGPRRATRRPLQLGRTGFVLDTEIQQR
ncbi:MAG: protein kinase [Myxococcales bacterium]|nr:protein kinase [Myxococcales bacterium]